MMKDDQLIFDSNFQSSNLMAVFKVFQDWYRQVRILTICYCKMMWILVVLLNGLTFECRINDTIL